MASPIDSARNCERDDDRENCEIEITREMIESGVAALEDGLSLDSDHWSLVRSVYKAMVECRSIGHISDPDQKEINSRLTDDVKELRRGMSRIGQILTNVREILASSDLSPRLRALLNMYRIPKNEMTITRCIGKEIRDTHVIVSTFVKDGTIYYTMVALSDLPNDLVSLEDLERAGIVIDNSDSA
jgi:hypothetical protein